MIASQQMISVPVSIHDWLAQGPDAFWDATRDAMSACLAEAIQTAVEHEVEQFVGAEWHERSATDRKTYRSGYRRRRFTVLGRDVDLRIPRVRRAGFRSSLLGHRRYRSEETDRIILDTYIAGASMRETTAQLYRQWGTSVSPSTISTLLCSFDQRCRRFQQRPLDDDYEYLLLDAMYVRCQVASSRSIRGARGGESVGKVAVLLVRGIHGDGRRELVDFRLAVAEREDTWQALLLSLYCRGLVGQTTRLFVHDGSEGLANALDTVFGPGSRQRCVCHKLGNVWDAVRDKDAHKSIRKDAANVYDVETAQEAYKALADFTATWRDREPQAVATLANGFETTLAFLSVPREHRRWVVTTNPIERLIRELRRRLRPMGTFQNLDSCRRLVFLAIFKLSDERRNEIPYSLWTSQPWVGRGGGPRPPRGRLPWSRLRLAFQKELMPR